MTPSKPGPFFPVPASTRPEPCRYCPATIYKVQQPSGAWMPVDCDTEDGWRPNESRAGEGVSHFSNCPGAARARKPR